MVSNATYHAFLWPPSSLSDAGVLLHFLHTCLHLKADLPPPYLSPQEQCPFPHPIPISLRGSVALLPTASVVGLHPRLILTWTLKLYLLERKGGKRGFYFEIPPLSSRDLVFGCVKSRAFPTMWPLPGGTNSVIPQLLHGSGLGLLKNLPSFPLPLLVKWQWPLCCMLCDWLGTFQTLPPLNLIRSCLTHLELIHYPCPREAL